jgi:phosphatidylglycerophosphatase C
MGSPIIEHQQEKGAQLKRAGPIVAFDFDGTLTVRDTFLAFLRWREGPLGYQAGLARLAPAASAFLITRDVERLKAAAVRTFLRGLPMPLLEQEAREYATTAAPILLRPDALKVWRRHRADGARMVIVTASPEAVIAPFARGLGADFLLGTRLAVDEQGRLTGALDGRNCRGPEKVRRLQEVFGEDVNLLAAYGDTDGDEAMLGIAGQRFMRLFSGDPTKMRPVG